MSLSFKKNISKGFTLIELLVSMGIMAAVLTVIIFGQRSYTESSTLLNAADEMAITVSQTQAYGIAVKETSAGSGNFLAGYGLSVTLVSGGNNTYISFKDTNNSQYYDGDLSCGSEECIEKIVLTRGNYIDSFCIVRTNGVDQCGVASRVDITFRRPETSANINFYNSGGQPVTLPNTKGVRITLKSPSGLSRSVLIYTSGQVSVE